MERSLLAAFTEAFENLRCAARWDTGKHVGRTMSGTAAGISQPGIWQHGHSTNLVGVPTGLLASTAFNDAAPALHLAGVRESNHGLFALLERANSGEQAAAVFEDYMSVVFGLHPEQRMQTNARDGRRRYRSSYLRLLRGWAYDSNSPEGAVLKGWVESRFGLFPTFHRAPITSFASAPWVRYIEEKMGSRFHNNAIYGQLDLLYEFAQWSFERIRTPHHLRLFRGINDFEEHPLIERIDRRCVVIRLNNIVSFTHDRDVATWFGGYILEAAVPAAKVLCFNTLLANHALKGEGEVLVIGGDYRVKATYD